MLLSVNGMYVHAPSHGKFALVDFLLRNYQGLRTDSPDLYRAVLAERFDQFTASEVHEALNFLVASEEIMDSFYSFFYLPEYFENRLLIRVSQTTYKNQISQQFCVWTKGKKQKPVSNMEELSNQLCNVLRSHGEDPRIRLSWEGKRRYVPGFSQDSTAWRLNLFINDKFFEFSVENGLFDLTPIMIYKFD